MRFDQDTLFQKLAVKFPFDPDLFRSLASKRARRNCATKRAKLINKVFRSTAIIDHAIILGFSNNSLIRAMAFRHFALKQIKKYIRP